WWLRETLREHRNQHVLVCLHHHPIRMQSEWLDHVGLRDADAFLGAIREHSNVRGVLWGHVHQSLDSFIHGVRFMATPATCAQFLPGSAEFALDNRPPGYRFLELMADGSMATEVCWLESYADRIVALRAEPYAARDCRLYAVSQTKSVRFALMLAKHFMRTLPRGALLCFLGLAFGLQPSTHSLA